MVRLAAYRTGRRVIQSFLCMATNFQGILMVEIIFSKSISRCFYIHIFTWSSLISVVSLYSKSRSTILRIDQSLRGGSRRTWTINIRWRERRRVQKAIKVSGENDFLVLKPTQPLVFAQNCSHAVSASAGVLRLSCCVFVATTERLRVAVAVTRLGVKIVTVVSVETTSFIDVVDSMYEVLISLVRVVSGMVMSWVTVTAAAV
jgi:hypothetical protein